MNTKLSDILSIVAYTFLFVAVLNGCIHSCNKHKDDPIWLQQTPAVAYRGVEYFWHDDFAGVDWGERIENDAATIWAFMNLSFTSTGIDETKMQIEDFSKRIRLYPPAKLDTLKKITKMYVRFSNAALSDLASYCESITNGVNIMPEDWSENAQKIADSIYNYNVTNLGMHELDSLAVALKMKAGFGEILEVKSSGENLQKRSQSLTQDLKDVYFRIFREKYF